MPTNISGKIVDGGKYAHRTLFHQIKYFSSLPLIDRLFIGTINIDLGNQQYKIHQIDYSFWGINWHPQKSELCETFGFIKVDKISYENRKYDIGYLYFASHSSHLKTKRIIELWCTQIEGLKVGFPIDIIVNEKKIEVV